MIYWDFPYLVKTKTYDKGKFMKVERWWLSIVPVDWDIISLRHLEEMVSDEK